MKAQIRELVKKSLLIAKKGEQWPDFSMPKIELDFPKDDKFGDYSTNLAMILARELKKSPMEIAEKIKHELLKIIQKDDSWKKIEVAEPGYINFYLSKKYFQERTMEIYKADNKFGESKNGANRTINIEFISSNPTGPIHLGNARGGPLGDTLGNVFEKNGYIVTREYYINDFGNQVEILGHSVLRDTEAQYKGSYIDDLSNRVDKDLKDPLAVGIWAAGIIVEEFIKPTCEKLGVNFDNWFSEKSLHDSGAVDSIIEFLKEKELSYEKDGALWFKSTGFGDDKDRVLLKSNGKKTYTAADLAYHKDKLGRGYDKIINIQGPDHHKEAEVVKSFAEKVLGEKNKIYPIITQVIRVIQGGKELKMSKRKGVYFALDDLIEEVGRDATRFIFTSYAPGSHINFDIDLARERSEKNPVYYVQYAHARICSILTKVQESTIKNHNNAELSLLDHPKEMILMKELNKFPELIEGISESFEAHRLPSFAISLADKFHSFYDQCQVISERDPELSRARLILINAVRIVLSETLRLIGVQAPKKM